MLKWLDGGFRGLGCCDCSSIGNGQISTASARVTAWRRVCVSWPFSLTRRYMSMLAAKLKGGSKFWIWGRWLFPPKNSLLKNISFDLETNWAGRPLALAGSFRGAFAARWVTCAAKASGCRPRAPLQLAAEAGKLLREHAHECKGVVPWRRHAPAQSWIWMMPAPLRITTSQRAPCWSREEHKCRFFLLLLRVLRPASPERHHDSSSSLIKSLACLARQDVQSFSVHAVRRKRIKTQVSVSCKTLYLQVLVLINFGEIEGLASNPGFGTDVSL